MQEFTVNRSRVQEFFLTIEEIDPSIEEEDSYKVVHVEQSVDDGDYRHTIQKKYRNHFVHFILP